MTEAQSRYVQAYLPDSIQFFLVSSKGRQGAPKGAPCLLRYADNPDALLT